MAKHQIKLTSELVGLGRAILGAHRTLSVSEFCAELGIQRSTYYYWLKVGIVHRGKGRQSLHNEFTEMIRDCWPGTVNSGVIEDLRAVPEPPKEYSGWNGEVPLSALTKAHFANAVWQTEPPPEREYQRPPEIRNTQWGPDDGDPREWTWVQKR